MPTVKSTPTRFSSILLIVTAIAVIAGVSYTTNAQQNGTGCPDSISNGPDTMYLTLDAICDGYGDPQDSPYKGDTCYTGICDHDGCYSGPSYGLTEVCRPCPSSWQNCTPCPDYALNCGDDTPDPQPTPTP